MTRREWLLAAKADIALALLRTHNAIDYLREAMAHHQAVSSGLPWLTCAHEDLRTADARIDAALDGCER